MKVAVFSTKPYDRRSLEEANSQAGSLHELTFFDPRLGSDTAFLAGGFDAVCAFVNDNLQREVLQLLAEGNVRLIALRCAGFNNVDVPAAHELGMTVARVPDYSPHAVAEHAAALLLGLNRKLHRAHNRVREGNFSLAGLEGFDLWGKTVGVVGTGRIGACFAAIARGFGCHVLAFDVVDNPELNALGVEKVSLDELLQRCDVVSLHCPLTPETHHLINRQSLARMKRGAFLLNTSRGALVETSAVLAALRSGQLGAFALDVYENEAAWFFDDHSGEIPDEALSALLSMPNVLLTGHQAFLTHEALDNIAQTTLFNCSQWEKSGSCDNAV